MRTNKAALLAAVAISATTGLAAASIGTRGGDAPTLPPGANDGTPQSGTEHVDAREREPRSGREIGVLVYRNRSGKLCMAQGQTSGSRVGVHRRGGFKAIPLREGGTCGLRLDPFAASVERTYGQTIVSGVARSDVDRVQISAEGFRHDVKPGRSGGFIVAFDEEIVGDVQIVAHGPGGARTVTVPGPGKSLSELSEEMKRSAPRPGQPPPEFPHR
jgi:hypothetical protein